MEELEEIIDLKKSVYAISELLKETEPNDYKKWGVSWRGFYSHEVLKAHDALLVARGLLSEAHNELHYGDTYNTTSYIDQFPVLENIDQLPEPVHMPNTVEEWPILPKEWKDKIDEDGFLTISDIEQYTFLIQVIQKLITRIVTLRNPVVDDFSNIKSTLNSKIIDSVLEYLTIAKIWIIQELQRLKEFEIESRTTIKTNYNAK